MRVSIAVGLMAALAVLLVPCAGYADAIDDLLPGHWYMVPNSRLDAVLPNPLPPGDPFWITAWSGGAFDSQRNRFIVWGGGHGDYAGNEIYAFNMTTLQWTRVNNPSPDVGGSYSSGYYPDGNPRSRHTYNSITYLPNIDRFCSFGASAGYQSGAYMGEYVDCFNFNNLQWERKASVPGNVGPEIAFASYDPVTGYVWAQSNAISGGRFFRYDPIANTWTTYGTDPNGWIRSFTPAIDPIRRKFVAIGFGFVRQWNLNNPGAGESYLNTTGANSMKDEDYPGFEYDPVTDRFIAWNGGGTVYSLNMDTAVWSAIPASGGNIPTAHNQTGTHGRFRYCPNRNVFVVMNNVNENVYVYRLTTGGGAADTEPPTVSVTSPTGGTVSGTISVTATASDNVGVAGVSFTLDGVNLGTEDTSSPYSITWNTTTAANGAHVLRAVARDAANLATISAPVNVTVSNVSGVGTLVHDGPVTPEQISMYLPVTGSVSAVSATVRWRLTAGSTWTDAHPLHRIRPAFTATSVPDAFAGVITGLSPGVSYTVEVTVPAVGTQSLVATTRSLPPVAGAPNKTIAAGSTQSQIQTVLNGLNPGDVLQFQDGTYTVSSLTLNLSGTPAQPIFIRGQSRGGVVIRNPSQNGNILQLQDASDIVFEDLTMEGSLVDGGVAFNVSRAVEFFSGNVQQRVTFRQVTINGVDQGLISAGAIEQLLVYDCTFTGNNVWTQPFLETNITWNDDGIRVPGEGNAVFNNTVSGFGDTFAMVEGTESVGIHFYRNEVPFTDDDAFEGDYGYRNITFYDNRIGNSMTLVSFDPIYGGPAFVFRNISINAGRSPYKFNSQNSGQFIYNNTVVRTTGYQSGDVWGWNQANNGPQRAWGYRNNILIFRGAGNLMAMESGSQNPIDFTNNAWFPDGQVWWSNTGGSFSSMAVARASIPATTPVFSTSTQRHQNDVITVSDPFVTDVVLGANYLTKNTVFYVPSLSAGTTPKNTGVAIPGITDGFTGSAPDMGAVIEGRATPIYGDRGTGAPAPDTVVPAPPHTVRFR